MSCNISSRNNSKRKSNNTLPITNITTTITINIDVCDRWSSNISRNSKRVIIGVAIGKIMFTAVVVEVVVVVVVVIVVLVNIIYLAVRAYF